MRRVVEERFYANGKKVRYLAYVSMYFDGKEDCIVRDVNPETGAQSEGTWMSIRAFRRWARREVPNPLSACAKSGPG